jgi:hypothetical protein
VSRRGQGRREEFGHSEPRSFNVQNPDPSNALARALNIDGAEQLQFLEPRFRAAVIAESLLQPEYWWLRRGRTFQATIVQPAVAGERSYATFSINNNQVALAVLQVRAASVAAAADLQWGVGVVPGPTTAQIATPMDTRHNEASQFLVQFGHAAAPVLPANFNQAQIPAGATGLFLDLPGLFVVGPTQLYSFTHLPVNTGLRVTFTWRERPLLPFEV